MISDKKPVQDFVALCQAKGIEHIVITPGSRNAPFSISFHEHPSFHTYSIIDERSAGFFALGISQQIAKPAVIICTSGTAALNLAPAIAEAYYQRVPLLIITADRPIEWIDQGEGQSIRQRDVFRNYVKGSYEIAEEASDGDLVWYNVRLMDEAMRLCTEGVHGPVHINFPLRESLYKTIGDFSSQVKEVKRASTDLSLSDDEKEKILNTISTAKSIMVLAGQMLPNESLLKSLKQFSANPRVIVFTEAHSNLTDENFVTTIDRLIMGFDEERKKNFIPDLLISIGRNIISRKIKEYLRSGKMEHWHVDISGECLDTMKNLTKVIPLSPEAFFEELKTSAIADNKIPGYGSELLKQNSTTRNSANLFLQSSPFSDLKAFDTILKRIPAGSDLQMGNSSVVRYVLLSDARKDLHYFGNRGVAGIDGCTSTAVGAAYITKRLTTLITGDIGFMYDSNAFWNEYVSPKLKVIVINNGGGGIFRIIEGPSTTNALEKFFETTHSRKADKLAAMYNLNYRLAENENQLEDGLTWLYSTNDCSILEVSTPRLENDKVLKNYFDFIKNKFMK
ncbi:MAG: 2-succinyl-5-enolpyruvyl-6-hydroxy-3-cyclohexene-1-carboxylic-acid synthase [Flavobacteriales bacterium]|nr:2-succinyl-5-enolpyruvyl-6-hydroxy-3-cyclohexene-1-carboxylic-acid synthase [Flavobacteriales bacterium]